MRSTWLDRRLMGLAAPVVRLWDLRTMYGEWADLHAEDAVRYAGHAKALRAFADGLARSGLPIQAAFNGRLAEHYQRVHDHFRQMAAKYRRAAWRPWSVVPSDPEPPALPSPLRI
jgi:hypothetical protein